MCDFEFSEFHKLMTFTIPSTVYAPFPHDLTNARHFLGEVLTIFGHYAIKPKRIRKLFVPKSGR
jgi:hypothetical protein